MKTKITELFGCKYPIFQGGMAWIAESTLASAVTNAGGVGIIAGGFQGVSAAMVKRCAAHKKKFASARKKSATSRLA